MQNSIYKIKYLLFLSWDLEAWCLTQSGGVIPPSERNTAWNMGRKCFHCLGAPNNLIRPWERCNGVFWLLITVEIKKMRPEDGPVQGPKHFSSIIKLHHLISCLLTLLPLPSYWILTQRGYRNLRLSRVGLWLFTDVSGQRMDFQGSPFTLENGTERLFLHVG